MNENRLSQMRQVRKLQETIDNLKEKIIELLLHPDATVEQIMKARMILQSVAENAERDNPRLIKNRLEPLVIIKKRTRLTSPK